MEVELETFAEEEEDTIELGMVQELGTEILEMILEQVFRLEDEVPQSSPGSTMAQLSQAPLEHVDVDRGACEESGAKGQFSEHTQGETHVPTVVEEVGSVGKHSSSTGHRVQRFVLSMGHGGPGLYKNRGWLLL
jgi:hypothetical protein